MHFWKWDDDINKNWGTKKFALTFVDDGNSWSTIISILYTYELLHAERHVSGVSEAV